MFLQNRASPEDALRGATRLGQRYLFRMKGKAFFGTVLVAGALVGCSTTGTKVSQAQVDAIQVGDSKEEVQSLIGAPDEVTRNATSENWVYSYRRSSPNAKRFIPLLGHFIGGKNVETQRIEVMFDNLGQVADVEVSFGGTDAKGRPVTTSTGTDSATDTPR